MLDAAVVEFRDFDVSHIPVDHGRSNALLGVFRPGNGDFQILPLRFRPRRVCAVRNSILALRSGFCRLGCAVNPQGDGRSGCPVQAVERVAIRNPDNLAAVHRDDGIALSDAALLRGGIRHHLDDFHVAVLVHGCFNPNAGVFPCRAGLIGLIPFRGHVLGL